MATWAMACHIVVLRIFDLGKWGRAMRGSCFLLAGACAGLRRCTELRDEWDKDTTREGTITHRAEGIGDAKPCL